MLLHPVLVVLAGHTEDGLRCLVHPREVVHEWQNHKVKEPYLALGHALLGAVKQRGNWHAGRLLTVTLQEKLLLEAAHPADVDMQGRTDVANVSALERHLERQDSLVLIKRHTDDRCCGGCHNGWLSCELRDRLAYRAAPAGGCTRLEVPTGGAAGQLLGAVATRCAARHRGCLAADARGGILASATSRAAPAPRHRHGCAPSAVVAR
mmetsp:Transcript_40398/g.89714  ORF Transcript_40398/g.89714 Transcript_40398/m.89714 type:complete len:208 (+) Transcript_40398:2089-2712(+)